MRIPLPTPLKTRDGTLTKDSVITNGLISKRGSVTDYVAKRPGITQVSQKLVGSLSCVPQDVDIAGDGNGKGFSFINWDGVSAATANVIAWTGCIGKPTIINLTPPTAVWRITGSWLVDPATEGAVTLTFAGVNNNYVIMFIDPANSIYGQYTIEVVSTVAGVSTSQHCLATYEGDWFEIFCDGVTTRLYMDGVLMISFASAFTTPISAGTDIPACTGVTIY